MRYAFLIFISIITVLVLRINLKLYSNPETKVRSSEVVLQLNFLENELKNNDLGTKMQFTFPEGFVFINALYGLSWCELASGSEDPGIRVRAVQEANYAYQQINSEKGKETFDSHLKPEFGIFYNGWRNYLLAKLLSIHKEKKYPKDLVQEFKSHSASIASAMENAANPFLQSYSGSSWPADIFLAVASLQIHDQLFEPTYQGLIKHWVKSVRLKLDSKSHMIPHRTEADTGEVLEAPRGGSMTLMLRLLFEIDQNFAKEQYDLFKKNFSTSIIGLPAVREYPKGEFGIGDIDSGPVILGVGPAATIVSIGTLSLLGDKELSDRIYLTVNAFGVSIESKSKKKYLLGVLPIADAFIAWGNASSLGVPDTDKKSGFNWRLKFQIVSFVFIVFIWFLLYRKHIVSLLSRVRSK